MDAQVSTAPLEQVVVSHTARSNSVESGTYDFYGESAGTLEDLSWMYDRKAVELVPRAEEEGEEGTYDMFF